jgi:hypothetical protein
MDQIDLDRSISPNRPNSDASSKRSRIQAVFLSRSSNANDKKGNSVLANSVGVLSHPTNNTSGPGGGTNGANDAYEHPNVVATLSQHASAAMPVASLVLPTNKVQTTNTNSTSSSAKQFLIRRVRSHSKSDPQSVPDKSLFSRFFPKKTKKPLPTLLTATTKSIDTNSTINHTKKRTNNNLLTTDYQPSNNYEEDEDDEFDDRTVSMGSLSDTDQQNHKDNRITGTRSSNITRGGSRTNSGGGKTTSAGPNALSLPTSDSQYYASMSSAPTGFSISYHKRMSKGNDDLRIQAALGRLQQQSKQGTANGGGGGTSQLMVCQFLSKNFFPRSRLFLFLHSSLYSRI